MAAARDDHDQLMARVRAVHAEVEQARREAEQAQAKAAALAGQCEAIFAAVADGLLVYDGHGRILHSNVALRTLLALDRQPDFISRPLCERGRLLIPRDEQGRPIPAERWPASRVLRGEVLTGAQAVDLRLRALDGREVEVDIRGVPVYDQGGRLAGGVLVVHDVTERRRLERRTHEMRGRLRADFIAAVSHDLRTPLTAAQAALGLVVTSAHDRLRPDERDLLENARRNIGHLGLRIDDLLTVNQLEAGTLGLEHATLDLRSVVTGAIAVVQRLLREKRQALEVDVPEPLPTAGDPRRLEQAVVNLLANAHEHTPPGARIVISGRVTGGEVLLVVSDNGPGIPAEELEAIFQRFHRLDPSGGGSGLGLAIVRGIVELHGGRIWAASRRGAGTAFHVVLPLEREDGTL